MVRRIAGLVIVGGLALAGVAWAAQAGTYSGHTSQPKGSISLKVNQGKIVHVTFVAGNGHGAGCGPAATVQPQFPVSFKAHMAIARNGEFSGNASPRDLEMFKISGRLHGTRITGSFTDEIPLGQLTSTPKHCSSGKVTFTATRTTQ